ncbi:MAG: arylsulfatase [Planctomycetes bacterium]|nr:arylsulfatase [Planctomycetota bacterium]
MRRKLWTEVRMFYFDSYKVPVTGGLLLIAALGSPSNAVGAEDKPNIVLIYTDDQGYGDCSLLNPEAKFQTPNIDRIGRDGIVFTDGHSSDTVCTPSRYALLTGRYSWRTRLKKGVINSTAKPLVSTARATLATLLKRNGYHTAMVGKWHLGMDFEENGKKIADGPLNKGFDYFFGIPASMNYGYCAWYENETATMPPFLFTKKKPNSLVKVDPRAYRITPPYSETPKHGNIKVAADFEDVLVLERFTEKAVAWIESVHDDARPFFLYFPLTSPHKPVIPQERFRGKSKAGAYGDFMVETDHWVGEIIQALERHGIYQDTLIIFSSDNGPENTWKKRIDRFEHYSAGKYRGGKRDIYEGGHRVPFLISWPKGIASGRRYDGPVNQVDIYATLAEIVGDRVGQHEAEDSVSFAPVLRNEAFTRVPMIHHSSRGGFAIRAGDWKLVVGAGREAAEPANGLMELYDLKDDPAETTNVIGQHPGVAERLKDMITEIILKGRTGEGSEASNDTPVEMWWRK